MPYRVNGIGTGYYGKRELKKEAGVCKHCHREVELLSYQTRLWFSMFYIPIIPLQEKQILRQCPRCTRHIAMSLLKWREGGKEEVAQARAEWNAHPDQADAAMRLLNSLEIFQSHDEAAAPARDMQARFRDDFTMQMYLGAFFERMRMFPESDTCFARALDLQPNDLQARRAAAVGCIKKGDLGRARKLLSYMEQKGPDQEYRLLAWLADEYQKRGEQGSSIEIFRILCRDFPKQAAKDKKLRKAVKIAERAQGGQATILPRAAIEWKWVALFLAVALALAAGWLVNQGKMRNQTLHIVNGFTNPVRVTIAGIGNWSLKPWSRLEEKVPEGNYLATVRVGENPEERFGIHIYNSLFQRFAGRNAFVLNAGGGAALVWESTVYKENHDENEENPSQIHVNDLLLTLRKVDYPFQPFPDTLTLKQGSQVTKARLFLISEVPGIIVSLLQDRSLPVKQIANYAETHLLANPANQDLLERYTVICRQNRLETRASTFMKKYLKQRPVQIEWHRAYQNLFIEPGRANRELEQEYDALLQAEPKNSALLYLRGRLCMDKAEAGYYDRAIEADAANPYPWNAKGFDLMTRAEFAAAKECFVAASRFQPANRRFSDRLIEVRLALRELAPLENDLREKQKSGLDNEAAATLMQVLFLQGKRDTCLQLKKEIGKAYASELRRHIPDPDELQKMLEQNLPLFQRDWDMTMAYMTGDLPAYLEMAKAMKDQGERDLAVFGGSLSQLKLVEADAALSRCKTYEGDLNPLLMWLGWKVIGRDETAAAPWLEKAVDSFSKSPVFIYQKIGRLLQGKESDVNETLSNFNGNLIQHAILAIALAVRFPGQRRELLIRAKKLNFDLHPPAIFLRQVIAALRNQ